MSSSLFFLFLINHFNFFFCQISPNYRFLVIIDDIEYDLSINDNLCGIQFSLILINKTEITLSFDHYYNEAAVFVHNSDFPQFIKSLSSNQETYPANSFIECQNDFRLLQVQDRYYSCCLVSLFNPPNNPKYNPISITFKAEEIKTDVNEDDNEDDLVVKVLILTYIVSLIIFYYLLLLLCT